MQTAFSIKNLTLKYGKETVVEGLTCEIEAGRVTYIIGGNGAGKTTLMRTLIGIIKPTGGTIKIFGEELTSKNISKHIGYVPQSNKIDRDFPITVSEMIALECEQQKHCKIGIGGHLKVFRAEKLLDKKISDLSGGEIQKALIARALVSNPEIIILDEPFNNLDHETELELIELLHKLQAEQGKTIIFVTHDLDVINAENSDALYLTHKKGYFGKSSVILNKHKLSKI